MFGEEIFLRLIIILIHVFLEYTIYHIFTYVSDLHDLLVVRRLTHVSFCYGKARKRGGGGA